LLDDRKVEDGQGRGHRNVQRTIGAPYSGRWLLHVSVMRHRVDRALMATARQLRAAARRTFLEVFPDGFRDELYLSWERDYKVEAHRRWREEVGGKAELRAALDAGRHKEVAAAAVRVESSRPLLFSFEKMALRDAVVRSESGARRFAEGLYDWLHGPGGEPERFDRWAEVVQSLPRRKTRVATWPVVTVFGAIARPRVHFFAAEAYGFDLRYRSTPSWETYSSVLELARVVRADLADLRPRDQIDIQSFLWVLGSDEYAEARAA
jgi:hypothetical protein